MFSLFSKWFVLLNTNRKKNNGANKDKPSLLCDMVQQGNHELWNIGLLYSRLQKWLTQVPWSDIRKVEDMEECLKVFYHLISTSIIIQVPLALLLWLMFLLHYVARFIMCNLYPSFQSYSQKTVCLPFNCLCSRCGENILDSCHKSCCFQGLFLWSESVCM